MIEPEKKLGLHKNIVQKMDRDILKILHISNEDFIFELEGPCAKIISYLKVPLFPEDILEKLASDMGEEAGDIEDDLNKMLEELMSYKIIVYA